MNDLTNLVKQYKELFLNHDLKDCAEFYKIAKGLYDSLYQHYDYCEEKEDVQQQHRICVVIDEEILPRLNQAIMQVDVDMAQEMFDLYQRFFALSARRVLKNFALYIEYHKKKKVWDKTLETMKPVFHYLDRFSIKEHFNLMRVSLMPGIGKSYIGNLFVAQSIGNDRNIQILRITYSDDLVKITTKQTQTIIDSKAFRDIFPRYKDVPIKKIFKAHDKYSFSMCDCEDEYNLFGFTRDGQATGKRGKIVIIDDVLKGAGESTNVDLHKSLMDKFDADWSSRADDDKQKTLLLGTMWSNTDPLNVLYDRALAHSVLVDSKLFKYTELTSDGTSVFIGIPALDENDRSTCPLRYSTEFLLKKRADMEPYLWQAVYQQDPIAPSGISFDYGALKTYDKLPKINNSVVRYGSLDPARRGKNYVSMPIFYRFSQDEEKFYLVDCLYQKKAMNELYDSIVAMIIEHRLSHLVIENNTDTSLKYVLETKLRALRYFGCTIVEKYSVANKEQRIKDNQGYMRNNIIYPKKGLFPTASDISQGMENFVTYSFDYPTKFDDFPDSIALFTMEYINGTSKPLKAKAISRLLLGF